LTSRYTRSPAEQGGTTESQDRGRPPGLSAERSKMSSIRSIEPAVRHELVRFRTGGATVPRFLDPLVHVFLATELDVDIDDSTYADGAIVKGERYGALHKASTIRRP